MSRAATADARLDAVFTALADPTRRRIVARLARGSATVGEIAEPFAISLPAISKHLDVLGRAGLVQREREGRFQRCTLDARALDPAAELIARYRDFWEDALERLARYVEDDP